MLIELLAAVAADPTHFPLWIVAAFAAGMYPIGFMLGAPCSPCCGKCSNCEQGTLPETVTVTLNGYTDKSQGPYLCGLTFSSCYGNGASGRVTAPGGDPDEAAGPITAVELTSAGSGYAKFGRVIPTVSATGSGSGATFDVTLTQSQDNCDLDFWEVSKITITGAGIGYSEDEFLQFSVAEGDTEQSAAVVRLQTQREEPTATLEVSSATGSGAELSVTFESIGGTPEQWRVDAVSVDEAGDLYATGDEVAFTFGTNTLEVGPASFFVKAAHAAPTVEAQINYSSGTGASLAVTLSQFVYYDGSDMWAVDSISVADGGSGYAEYDSIDVVAIDGIVRDGCGAYVESVDEGGAILSVAVYSGGAYFKGGPITEVEVTNPGVYYGDSGVPIGVEIDNGGMYFREDATAPPYVADVTVSINQTLPSEGAGAEISATVGADPEDAATWGRITALTIDAAGDNYLAWRWLANNCCGHYMNAKQIVLKRDNVASYTAQNNASVSVGGIAIPAGCVYSHRLCGGWQSPFGGGSYSGAVQTRDHAIRVAYRGPTVPPIADVSRFALGAGSDGLVSTACAATFTATTLIPDCSDFSFLGTAAGGMTVTVAPGGEYEEDAGYPGKSIAGCSACCQGTGIPPEEITVSVSDHRPGAVPNISGSHVLARLMEQVWTLDIPVDEVSTIQLRVWVEAAMCSSQPDDGCDHCIKKCATMGAIILPSQDGGDSRFCGADNAAKCAAACTDAPICQPVGGTQIVWRSNTGGVGCGDILFTMTI